MPGPQARLMTPEVQGLLERHAALLDLNTPRMLLPGWLVTHQWPGLSERVVREAIVKSGVGQGGGKGRRIWVRQEDVPRLAAWIDTHVLPGERAVERARASVAEAPPLSRAERRRQTLALLATLRTDRAASKSSGV